MTCGIYMIRNKVNGKMYIGQAVDIEGDRWEQHRRMLRGDYHDNKHMQNAWNKYGEESFEFSILLECKESDLNMYEQYYIFELMTYDSKIGYNKTYGGEGGRPTEETKRKISESLKGKTLSDGHRKKISETMKTKRCGENSPMYGKTGEKCPNYGKKHTEETKRKMSEAHKGENNHNYGKHLSEETKKKISENHANVKGENHPMYGRTGENNPNSKPVIQIDPNTNEVINTYSGANEAARQTGFNANCIGACCRGERKTHKGYKWMFLSDYEKLR